MHTQFIRFACRVLILAVLAVVSAAPDASAQFFRRTTGCNCAMCQAIRAGTWKGSYAATFGTRSTTASTSRIVEEPADPAFASTPIPVVRRMVELADLTDRDVVYDPGCGDGRIVEEAVRVSGCVALGIERNVGIAARARARLRNLFPRRLRIQTGDSCALDLSGASVGILYMYPEDLQRIVPRLTMCRRIISWQHRIPGMLNRRVEIAGGVIYIADRVLVYDCAPPLPNTLDYSCEPQPVRTISVSLKRPITQPVLACRGGT